MGVSPHSVPLVGCFTPIKQPSRWGERQVVYYCRFIIAADTTRCCGKPGDPVGEGLQELHLFSPAFFLTPPSIPPPAGREVPRAFPLRNPAGWWGSSAPPRRSNLWPGMGPARGEGWGNRLPIVMFDTFAILSALSHCCSQCVAHLSSLCLLSRLQGSPVPALAGPFLLVSWLFPHLLHLSTPTFPYLLLPAAELLVAFIPPSWP